MDDDAMRLADQQRGSDAEAISHRQELLKVFSAL